MNINQDSANKFVTFEAIIKNGEKGHIVNINFIIIQIRICFYFLLLRLSTILNSQKVFFALKVLI